MAPLAAALVDRGTSAGLPCTLANDVHYPLDYGTVMPLVCYLDRLQRVPVVPVSAMNAPSMMIGYRAARLIKEERGRSGDQPG